MLAVVNVNLSQNLYCVFLISFSIIVIPFQNIDIEKIINEIININDVFCKIPKYEIGWILGSNSGKR